MSHADATYKASCFAPGADAFACPRGFDLDARERDADAHLRQMRSDVAIAEATGDAATIAMCRDRLDAGERLSAAVADAAKKMIDAEAAHANAVERVQRAWSRRADGTLDADEALDMEREVIAASAEERARRNALPALRAAVTSPASRLEKMRHDDDAKARQSALDDTRRIASAMFCEFSSSAQDRAAAEQQGAATSPAVSAWWPYAEQIVCGEVAARCAERSERHHAKEATVGDFAACLTTRRHGYQAAKRRALLRAEELREQYGS